MAQRWYKVLTTKLFINISNYCKIFGQDRYLQEHTSKCLVVHFEMQWAASNDGSRTRRMILGKHKDFTFKVAVKRKAML